MDVGVFGFRVGCLVGGFAGPVRILPYDEGFVQGVEAVTAEAGGVDGTGFCGLGISLAFLAFESGRNPKGSREGRWTPKNTYRGS